MVSMRRLSPQTYVPARTPSTFGLRSCTRSRAVPAWIRAAFGAFLLAAAFEVVAQAPFKPGGDPPLPHIDTATNRPPAQLGKSSGAPSTQTLNTTLPTAAG